MVYRKVFVVETNFLGTVIKLGGWKAKMRNSFFYGVGGVLSADIAVPNHEVELDFYASILTTGSDPLWRNDLMNHLGTPIIGLGARKPEYDFLPLQWMPHFQVADVADSAESAISMGGEELMHSKSDEGQSEWAVMTDQNGTAFGLIPAVEETPGTQALNEKSGHISWLSLLAPDAISSRKFYEQVVGWNSSTIADESNVGGIQPFEMKMGTETSVAQIQQLGSESNSIPPVWLIHLTVGNLAESLERVIEKGGEVIQQMTAENYAVIRDPEGVCLALQDASSSMAT